MRQTLLLTSIRLLVDGRGPVLVIGKDDDTSDQIKFRLSDCVFEYGDFRDEESADKYEGFLVVASSKGRHVVPLRAERLRVADDTLLRKKD